MCFTYSFMFALLTHSGCDKKTIELYIGKNNFVEQLFFVEELFPGDTVANAHLSLPRTHSFRVHLYEVRTGKFEINFKAIREAGYFDDIEVTLFSI